MHGSGAVAVISSSRLFTVRFRSRNWPDNALMVSIRVFSSSVSDIGADPSSFSFQPVHVWSCRYRNGPDGIGSRSGPSSSYSNAYVTCRFPVRRTHHRMGRCMGRALERRSSPLLWGRRTVRMGRIPRSRLRLGLRLARRSGMRLRRGRACVSCSSSPAGAVSWLFLISRFILAIWSVRSSYSCWPSHGVFNAFHALPDWLSHCRV